MESLGVEILIALLILILYILSAHILEINKILYVHESSISIALGVIAGLLIYYTDSHERIEFSTEIFFYLILPPIIFSAGFTLKSDLFFINIGYITLFGFLGTFLSFVAISVISLYLTANGLLQEGLSTKECLLLACVLSATDTVAAHSVVKHSKYPHLNSILFGEGVINDAVSIVLFRTVEIFAKDVGLEEILQLLLRFLYITTLSIAIGVLFGLVNAWTIKRLGQLNEYPARETTLIILVGYTSYMVSELFHLSGIMTIFCCGATMARYTWSSLSVKSQHGTTLALVSLSQTSEAFTFTYLGLTAAAIPLREYNFLFLASMFVAMLLGRAVSIFCAAGFAYVVKGCSFGLGLTKLAVCWFCGLIRGAIAFALVLQINADHSEVLVSSTLGISLFTSVFLSALLGPFCKCVKLESTPEEVYHDLVKTEEATYDQISWFHRLMNRLDSKFLNPFFGGSTSSNTSMNWQNIWAADQADIKELA